MRQQYAQLPAVTLRHGPVEVVRQILWGAFQSPQLVDARTGFEAVDRQASAADNTDHRSDLRRFLVIETRTVPLVVGIKTLKGSPDENSFPDRGRFAISCD